jgi:hypothetical protein
MTARGAGMTARGTRFSLCQFPPEHDLNPDTLARYQKNRLRVVPELVYSPWVKAANSTSSSPSVFVGDPVVPMDGAIGNEQAGFPPKACGNDDNAGGAFVSKTTVMKTAQPDFSEVVHLIAAARQHAYQAVTKSRRQNGAMAWWMP